MNRHANPFKSSRIIVLMNLFAAVITTSLSPAASADEVLVTTGEDVVDYEDGLTSLREAVQICPDGGTIRIAYDVRSVVLTKEIWIRKQLTIIPSGSNYVYLSAPGRRFYFQISGSDVHIVRAVFKGAGVSAQRSSSVTMTDCNLLQFETVQNRPVQVSDSSLVVKNCYFKGGVTGIYADNSDVFVERSKFWRCGNHSIDSQGAIRARLGQLSVFQSRFRDSRSKNDGGAIHADSCTVTVQYSEFIDNESKRSGGAIHLSKVLIPNLKPGTSWTDLTPTLKGCEFEGNVGAESGGAINSNASEALIVSSEFYANLADNGGAIQLSGGEMQIRECWFDDNGATNNGGALRGVQNASLNIYDSSMIGNTADVGGALDVAACRSAFHNSRFTSNKALSGQGGAIVGADSGVSLFLASCQLSDNKGGAIYSRKGTLGLESCVLTGNTGSAVHCRSNASFYDCTFYKNSGESGGAIRASKTFVESARINLTIQRCNFADNIAVAVNFSDNFFSYPWLNSTGCGGAIHVGYGCSCNVQDSTFRNNSATRNGGAIWVTEYMTFSPSDWDSPGTIYQTRNTFQGNDRLAPNGTWVPSNIEFTGGRYPIGSLLLFFAA